jgi:hypothetical protein
MYIKSALNFERDMILQLKANKNIFVGEVEWRSKKKIMSSNANSSCDFLSGTLQGTSTSSASLVHCGDRISGVIMQSDVARPIFIEPWNMTGTHVLYQISQDKQYDVSQDQQYATDTPKR